MHAYRFRCPSPALIAAATATSLSVACGSATPSPLPPAADPVTWISSGSSLCEHHDPNRNVFWGELHVHTGRSTDAWRSDVRTTPSDAYRFAKGEALFIPPLDASGNGTQRVQLERPLDFAAVTDHAEWMGGTAICTHPADPGYESQACRYFRRLPPHDGFPRPADVPPQSRVYEMLCGADGSGCDAALQGPWAEMQAAAAQHDDASSECAFTTFVAYEWSGARGGPLLHRNVIFRNDSVPEPVSSYHHPTPWHLYDRLIEECIASGTGCDVLAIPHNSNTSQGAMFRAEYPGATNAAEESRLAAQRAVLEPVVEIMQHKGDSECRSGFSNVLGDADEHCNFEKLFPAELPQCTGGEDLGVRPRCSDVGGFARYALATGLAEQQRIGVNPFQLGFIAATDTHNANAGQVEEATWKGHVGNRDATPATRMGQAGMMTNMNNNPGGLAAVWAEENSREAIFQALRRRETYGTSGPRISVRLFGGWDYPENLCASPDFASRGYAGGVPMGGVLAAAPDAKSAPVFAVQALRDPGTPSHPGGLLQRVQIVKLWSDSAGNIHQRIFDVAGDPHNGADVNLDTCEPRGVGADQLCSVWQDPEFDPDTQTAYYARVLENPSCRWTTHLCVSLPEDERPPGCAGSSFPDSIQERAWTSPVWYGG